MNNQIKEIPKDAKLINRTPLLPNIKEWFCPECGASGDENTADFLKENEYDQSEYPFVQYCCAECCEFGLYMTFNKD